MPIDKASLENYKHNGSTFDIYASSSEMDRFHFWDKAKANNMFGLGQVWFMVYKYLEKAIEYQELKGYLLPQR